jgi:predicted component of type VI protein secretion system
MGKLVLYFPDGSTRDVLLNKERTTIGRRPDNDIPLPSPAVSAEHAAVVTVLDDSFLEDLGSTNGTFVNEKPVTKHFLRDRDRVDIGREILVYYTDETAVPENLPPELFQHETPSNVLAPLDAHLAALEDLTRGRQRKTSGTAGSRSGSEARPVVAEFDPQSIGPMTGQVATEFDALISGDSETETTQRVRLRPESRLSGSTLPAEPPAASTTPTRVVADHQVVVRVIDGPNQGREIVLDRAETRIGRVGVEVVALHIEGDGARLASIDRETAAPQIATTRLLRPGDTFSVAGSTLQLMARTGAIFGEK